MSRTDSKEISCFCVFHHVPFERGKEGDEDGGHILEQLLYKYPDSYPPRAMEHLLSVLISLYTFTSLSNNKNLDFLSWSKSKVAIRTFKKKDNSLIFFVLRVPSTYSDIAISREIDLISKGILFSLGPENVSNNDILKEYLNKNGSHLSFTSFLPPPSSPPTQQLLVDPIPFSFSNIPNAEWHRPNLASALIEVTIMQAYPQVWGISCFSNGFLLASHMPIYIIRFFDFIDSSNSDSNQNLFSNKKSVYLTKEDRMNLLSYPSAISEIPDEDFIECSLIKFQHELVTFYLLTDPKIKPEVYEKIHETLSREMIEISSESFSYTASDGMDSSGSNSNAPTSTTTINEAPPNTIVYNSVLNDLSVGQPTDEFQRMAIEAHELFTKNEELRDMIMNNAKEFIVCMNILNVEYYASISGRSKSSLSELYNKAIKSMPGLQKYLKNLRLVKE